MMPNQMCPNHCTYASLPTTLIAMSEVTRALRKQQQKEYKYHQRGKDQSPNKSITKTSSHYQKEHNTNSRVPAISRNTMPKREGLVSKYRNQRRIKSKRRNQSEKICHIYKNPKYDIQLDVMGYDVSLFSAYQLELRTGRLNSGNLT